MPIYIPNNLQGSGNTTTTVLDDNTPTLLFEWGHFIENTPNLLMVNGGFALQSSGEGSSIVAVDLTMDNSSIDSKSISLLSTGSQLTEGITVDVGARLQNVTPGHHIFRLIVTRESATAGIVISAGLGAVTSISGPAQ
ncbi:hypothetical protein ABES80_08810 [Bacillus gobiensis]|uniref:hypothetical protein n=1 Tax=Bacillus gobiensis TaxID=1441095 RepID=UPI003D23758B